jgi:hypothetical protein
MPLVMLLPDDGVSMGKRLFENFSIKYEQSRIYLLSLQMHSAYIGLDVL